MKFLSRAVHSSWKRVRLEVIGQKKVFLCWTTRRSSAVRWHHKHLKFHSSSWPHHNICRARADLQNSL